MSGNCTNKRPAPLRRPPPSPLPRYIVLSWHIPQSPTIQQHNNIPGTAPWQSAVTTAADTRNDHLGAHVAAAPRGCQLGSIRSNRSPKGGKASDATTKMINDRRIALGWPVAREPPVRFDPLDWTTQGQLSVVARPRNQPQTPYAGVVQTGSELSGPTDRREPQSSPAFQPKCHTSAPTRRRGRARAFRRGCDDRARPRSRRARRP